MNKINSIFITVFLAGLFSITSSSAFAEKVQSEQQNDNIKIYLSEMTMGGFFRVSSPVDVSLVINGELVVAKNVVDPYQYMYSFIEVDNKFDFQEISQAKFTWLKNGKKLDCAAYDLPLYVQKGTDPGDSTIIYFHCK